MHLLLCLMVVCLVFTVAVKYLLKDDAKWQQVSAHSLANQMEHGIKQMYWQWQQEGRPASIEYRPEHVEHAMTINMSSTGKPIVGDENDTCNQILTWFVKDAAIDTMIQATTIPSEDALEDNRGRGCEFTVAKQVIFYQADTAHILY
jgi:hypothetical protein